MPLPTRSLSPALFCLVPGLFLAGCNDQSQSQAPSPAPSPEPPPPVSYTYEVRPLLARNCFGCHGQDEHHNKSGLRLDAPQFAFDPLDPDRETDRHAFVPGNRERSVAWQIVHPGHPEHTISPHHQNLALTSHDVELLGRWIDEGAVYEAHWAFQPLPQSVPLPDLSNHSWPRNEIDRFVLAPLLRAKLAPAPQADPHTLLRRLTLALTGLPPSIEDYHSFDPAHLESTVDRLLASPSFGEHLAALWLEAARYADPIGPDRDEPSTRWVYRNWVVSAFNDNLPFDRFLTAQLAGDLSDDPDLIVATAFNRLHPLGSGPETDPEAAIANNAAARVHTIGAAILGLRLHCAQCHDHKSDPVTSREFYALTAFFNSIPEHGLHQHPAIVPGPTHALPTSDQLAALFEAQRKVRQIEENLERTIAENEADFQSWLADPLSTPVVNDCLGIFSFDTRKETIPNQALTGTMALETGHLEFTDGLHGSAVRFDGETGLAVPDLFPVDRNAPWSTTLRFRTAERTAEPQLLLSRAAGPLSGPRGIELLLEDGHLLARLVREWPGNAIAVRTTGPVIAPGHWMLVSWSYDGSSTAAGMKLYVNGREAETEVRADSIWKPAILQTDQSLPLQLAGRPGARGLANGAIDEFQLHARALTPLEAATLYDGRSLGFALAHHPDHLPALREFYFSSLHEPAREARRELTAAHARLVALEAEIPEMSVMRELPAPRPTHLLAGGSFDAPRTDHSLVTRGVPEMLLPPGSPSMPLETRGDLAIWLTGPDHPLTARVFVNRIWAHFFGAGLVATPHDFGILGAAPTHPDLLDWLARDFVANHWDVKRLCKQIVLSSAFRQASEQRPEVASHEPVNDLLAPGPAVALPPDQVRDLVLHAAGLLDTTTAPPESPAPDREFARSLYAVRNHPVPSSPSTHHPDRCKIDYSADPPAPHTPGLTERELLVASRALAARLLREESDDLARLDSLFLRLHGRTMTPDEQAGLSMRLEENRARFDPDDPTAPQLVQPATIDRQSELDHAEQAAWTALVRTSIESQAMRR